MAGGRVISRLRAELQLPNVARRKGQGSLGRVSRAGMQQGTCTEDQIRGYALHSRTRLTAQGETETWLSTYLAISVTTLPNQKGQDRKSTTESCRLPLFSFVRASEVKNIALPSSHVRAPQNGVDVQAHARYRNVCCRPALTCQRGIQSVVEDECRRVLGYGS